MKNFIRSTVLAATAALGVVGFGSVASAATITSTTATVTGAGDIGTTWQVNFVCSAALPCNGGAPAGTLAAVATFELWDFYEYTDTREWIIKVTFKNTSVLPTGTSFLTALAFATDPFAIIDDFWQANSDGHNYTGAADSIPGFPQTELCAWGTAGQDCSAGNDHYLVPGMSDSFGFSLYTGRVASLTFSDFAARWVGTDTRPGSFDAGGTIAVAPVPLPAAGGLLLAGLGGLALLKRKKRAA